jgi:hypothetical protein
MITITQVLNRSVQGMTRPFFCGAEDGWRYYVKGAYAGKRSLCCEWAAGRLAASLLSDERVGTPVIELAEVPAILITNSSRTDIRDLGAGTVFASRHIEGGRELDWNSAQKWPVETQAEVLLLDLWLQNEDRSLSALGGNPNLLVTDLPVPEADCEGAQWPNQTRREMLWAYDFNLAFDEAFDRSRFFDTHVFGGLVRRWPEGFRERMEPRLKVALSQARGILAELPLEWLHLDGDESLPVQLDLDRVIYELNLPFAEPDTFWKLS